MAEERESSREAPSGEGLCGDCAFARRIESAKGSQFVLCGRSVTDAKFPKYPRLPIVECEGYLPKT